MKYRVEFREPTRRKHYFKEIEASSPNEAKNIVSDMFPGMWIKLVFEAPCKMVNKNEKDLPSTYALPEEYEAYEYLPGGIFLHAYSEDKLKEMYEYWGQQEDLPPLDVCRIRTRNYLSGIRSAHRKAYKLQQKSSNPPNFTVLFEQQY